MSPVPITSGLARIALGVVNAYCVSEPGGRWFLVDTGFPGQAQQLRRALSELDLRSRPEHILLTHAHFDHAGSARTLARAWGVPVYVHPLDIAYTRGRDYPKLDPTVGGALAMVTRLHRGPSAAQVGEAATPLPEDGIVPGFAGWRWLHTPGHTPGHVSLWREGDRTLIAGDACVTTDSDSFTALVTRTQRVCRPGAPTTYDWGAALKSVEVLASLHPRCLACGHGEPIVGPAAVQGLERLARTFQAPGCGRYVAEPVQFGPDGPTRIPKQVPDPLPRQLGLAALGGIAALIGWRTIRKAGGQHD
ncbi:MBL fold metallo-hydrolase [Methylobacterium sp. WL64]|uniref:MBL fold metallo-hydrolase n=1 Tax=Methylobacterium sp. WL64 TaxID=2603894 RepID=UPI0011CAB817|nr:MBL fold metallo-hydrolase [Methylobacterium sp. WL64]TXM99038.1 MBL fold metallo-hydrolase [Methylobacterium sp. WL64]